MSDPVPHSRPTLGPRERDAVDAVITTGQVAQGPQAAALERDLSGWFHREGSVAVGSGSQALLAALQALGVGPGHRVAISAFTCPAVLYAVQWSGAEPVLLDTAEGSLAPSLRQLEEAGEMDACILVHPWGYPLDAVPWTEAVPVLVEDAAASAGARWEGRPVGSSGRVSILSFYATKMLCAGEGGAVLSDDPGLIERVRRLRDYDDGEGELKRFNFKMTDLQAAMARVQLTRLGEFLERRASRARRYDLEVEGMGLVPVRVEEEARPAFFRYLCWSPVDVGTLTGRCQQQGVFCRRPVPVPLYRLTGGPELPNSREAWHHLVSLPLYPTLTEGEQTRVLEVLNDVLEEEGGG
ncbi:MAG: DegT/DnrJ/EryC1/StrS aminotransferase family protein [bacterium]